METGCFYIFYEGCFWEGERVRGPGKELGGSLGLTWPQAGAQLPYAMLPSTKSTHYFLS